MRRERYRDYKKVMEIIALRNEERKIITREIDITFAD